MYTTAFGIRCSYVLTIVGLWLYAEFYNLGFNQTHTLLDDVAFLCLLSQPTFLRRAAHLVTSAETWAVVIVSSLAGWHFASCWVASRLDTHYLTLGWAAYALLLFLLGLCGSEHRQRWCGLAVLVAALVRVFIVDFWGLSNGYRILTFLVLTLITLGLGYILLRNADRAKKQPRTNFSSRASRLIPLSPIPLIPSKNSVLPSKLPLPVIILRITSGIPPITRITFTSQRNALDFHPPIHTPLFFEIVPFKPLSSTPPLIHTYKTENKPLFFSLEPS